MAQSIKVLLVEDDKKYAQSLLRVLNAAGYECIWADKPSLALDLLKQHNFDAAIIDCMLPQMNGVELAVKINETSLVPTRIYLTSGIYKDRNFTINAMKKTNAKSFLIKPFEVEELIKLLKSDFSSTNTTTSANAASVQSVSHLLQFENLTAQLFDDFIRSTKTILGLELFLLFNTIFQFKVNIAIKFTWNSSEQLTLHFNKDRMTFKNINTSAQEWNSLLLNSPWLAMENKTTSSLESLNTHPEHLLTTNLISPHALEKLQTEIFIKRLQSALNTTNVQLQVLDVPESNYPNVISVGVVENLLIQWLEHNSVDFSNYYKPFENMALKRSPLHTERWSHHNLVTANNSLLGQIDLAKSIQELKPLSPAEQNDFYKTLHLLIGTREYFLSHQTEKNTNNKSEKLFELYNKMKSLNHFERLGAREVDGDNEIKKCFISLSQNFHPDKVQNEAESIKLATQKIYELVQDSYAQIKTEKLRENYLAQLKKEKQIHLQQFDQLVEQTIAPLTNNDYSTAEKLLLKADTFKTESDRFKLVQIWFYIKTKKQPISNCNRIILTISNDNQNTPLYLLVRGLLFAAQNDYEKASVSLKNALNKDPNFIAARRELTQLSAQAPSPKDKSIKNLLNADVKDVIGLFFKKRS